MSTPPASRYTPRPSWQDKAKCKGMDTNIFYGHNEDKLMTSAEIAVAKQICWPCPVRTDCLRVSLDEEEHYGVWGGFAPHERKSAMSRANNNQFLAMEMYAKGVFVVPRKRSQNGSER